MDPEAIRAYVSRDWDAIAASKRAYWAERHRQDGPQATWNASQALLTEMRLIRPGYPAGEDRSADFATHVRLRSLLDRAAHAVARH